MYRHLDSQMSRRFDVLEYYVNATRISIYWSDSFNDIPYDLPCLIANPPWNPMCYGVLLLVLLNLQIDVHLFLP
jgi:hypothetical protein